MTMLLGAADEPPAKTRACVKPVPSPLPIFNDDAERCAWIVAEYKRRLAAQPLSNKARLARDIAATAFHISIKDLCGGSRIWPHLVPRQKIACIIRALTGASWPQIGHLLCRDHSTLLHAHRKYGAEIDAIIRSAMR